MIVKNAAEIVRWMEQDGKCGLNDDYCSPSCANHGRHVAICHGTTPFAYGTAVAISSSIDLPDTLTPQLVVVAA